MKTSLILICAFFFNTAVLLGEPLLFISESVNTWFLVGLEVVLLIVLYFNSLLKGLKMELVFDFKNLDVFTFQSPSGKKGAKSTTSSLFKDSLE